MALSLGSNCGFVSSQPTADPNGTGYGIQVGAITCIKDTSPTGSYKFTELGWYCSRKDNSTERAYELAVYTHDAGNNRPNAVVGSIQSGSNFTAQGWWTYGSLNQALTSATTYWIAIANAAGSETITIDLVDLNGSGYGRYTSASTLPSPWTYTFAASDTDGMGSIYALYEAAGRTTKNARSNPLGTQHGMALRHQ